MTPEPSTPQSTPQKTTTLHVRLDLRWVVIVLLLTIVGMVLLWRPWQTKVSANTRTVSVSGSATIKAKPDEYTFTPSYEFKDADKDAALKALTAKSDEVTSGLKKLGVSDSSIKVDSSGYNGGYYYNYSETDKSYAYTLNFTVTIDDDKLVQKVQDYLVGTNPTGNVSPNATFSTAKQKQLESQARDEATKEARAKADQSAKNLGFTVGAVKSVDDGGFDGTPIAMPLNATANGAATDNSKLQVQPGENELDYSVAVVYYIH